MFTSIGITGHSECIMAIGLFLSQVIGPFSMIEVEHTEGITEGLVEKMNSGLIKWKKDLHSAIERVQLIKLHQETLIKQDQSEKIDQTSQAQNLRIEDLVATHQQRTDLLPLADRQPQTGHQL